MECCCNSSPDLEGNIISHRCLLDINVKAVSIVSIDGEMKAVYVSSNARKIGYVIQSRAETRDYN